MASGRLLYTTRGSALIATMLRSPKAAERRLMEIAIENDQFFELTGGKVPEEIWERVRNREVSYLGFPIPSQFRLSKETVLASKSAYMIGKDKPWKRDFDLHLERLKCHGFFVKFLRDSLMEVTADEGEGDPAGEPLRLRHFRSSFYVFALGMTLATFAYFAERLRILS